MLMLGQRRVGEQILHSLMNSSFVAPVPEGDDAKLQESKKLLESVQEAVKHLENINNRHERLENTMTNPSIDELQLMIDEGYISSEGKIGKKFERAHPKGSKDKIAYDKMGRDAKKQFRLTWAKKEIQNMKEKFSKITSDKIIYENTGTYEPFAVIWRKEGGDDDAYKARTTPPNEYKNRSRHPSIH